MVETHKAQHALWYGNETNTDKERQRWQTKPTTLLMNDYQRLLTALFSEEFQIAMAHKNECINNPNAPWPTTKLATLKDIWDNAIVTRELFYKDASVYVRNPSTNTEYPGDEMSDGERVLFYLIGQCLEAPVEGIIIIDEPELHIHKAILIRVWDKIEASRPDCLFIYFTHDIEFAVSRTSKQKYAVRFYDGNAWDIVDIPDNGDLPEDVTVRILGSRKPVLFVEGEWQSGDASLFGKLYDGFTVLPVGSCENVIHLTNSYNNQQALHHLICRGIIDRNGRSEKNIEYLKKTRIYTIDYAELENLLLAEEVMREVAVVLGFDAAETEERIGRVKSRVFDLARRDIERICVNYTKRRLEQTLSKIGFEEKTIDGVSEEFDKQIRSLDIQAIYEARKHEMEEIFATGDYARLLSVYENKGAVKEIGGMFNLKSNEYPDFVLRQVGAKGGREVVEVLRTLAPSAQTRSDDSAW